MILVLVMLLAMALVPLARGRLGAMLDLRVRWAGLLVVASFPAGLAVVWANRRLPGIWVIGLGALLNAVAVVANGGVMPASVSALRTAGLDVSPGVFVNSDVLADPELLFLGDVFAVPASWPFANVFSVGDVLLALGAAYAIHAVSGSRLVPARFRRVPSRVSPEGEDATSRTRPAGPPRRRDR